MDERLQFSTKSVLEKQQAYINRFTLNRILINSMFKYLTILLIFCTVYNSFGQFSDDETNKELKADLIPSFSVFYAYEISGGDLSSRFGANHKVGGAFSLKFKTNWIISLEGSYMFGQDLKEEAYSVLDNLKTDDGQITSKFGTPGSIILSERGINVMLKGGKILPFLQLNKNSGPFIMGGIGFLQHKINIENAGNDTPQISEEYRPGYDHLTYGTAFSESIGYRLYAKNRMTNFYIAFEWTQGLTKNRRAYNYNTMEYDTKLRLDMLYSFKIGFIIPFARRAPKDFYTY